jgi:chromosomal replication initiator protein
VSKPNYRTWLAKTIGLEFAGNIFKIGVPNAFVKEYLERNQCSLVEKELIKITRNTEVKAVFSVADVSPAPLALDGPLLRATPTGETQLNPKYTFNTFVSAPENRLALTAALFAAENSGRPAFNPLYIHGPSGTGKTHLLHAIGNAASAKGVRVIYVTAEQFTNEFVASIPMHASAEFRNKYRMAGMLLIDGAEFFGGKVQTAESLLHLFNELWDSGRQIVLNSNCPPGEISKIDSRLSSRFNCGLPVPIQHPGFEARREILRTKAQADGMTLSPEVIKSIAENITQDVRVLEGALHRIEANLKLLNNLVTPGLLPGMIGDLYTVKQQALRANPEKFLEAGANYFKIEPAVITGRQRDGPTVAARDEIAYVYRQETNLSLREIGMLLGGRKPATISFAYSQISEELKSNPEGKVGEDIKNLSKIIRG